MRHVLRTGDLVLFAGSTWSARLVQAFTLSRWSHVGLVVRLPEFGDRPLLWEATRASKLRDIRQGVEFDGVQLVSLDDKVLSYPGEIAVRRLRVALPESARIAQVRRLLTAWHQRPYRNYVSKQLLSWWRGDAAVALERQGGFCSELVAEVYRHWRLLPEGRPAHDFVPRHFADGPLLVGGCLAPRCRILPA